MHFIKDKLERGSIKVLVDSRLVAPQKKRILSILKIMQWTGNFDNRYDAHREKLNNESDIKSEVCHVKDYSSSMIDACLKVS